MTWTLAYIIAAVFNSIWCGVGLWVLWKKKTYNHLVLEHRTDVPLKRSDFAIRCLLAAVVIFTPFFNIASAISFIFLLIVEAFTDTFGEWWGKPL